MTCRYEMDPGCPEDGRLGSSMAARRKGIGKKIAGLAGLRIKN
jgi:hypothetical protein